MTGTPAWMADAACRRRPVDLFFATRDDGVDPYVDARKICARCTVAAECLDLALEDSKTQGLWAGTTETDRRQLRRTRAAAARSLAAAARRAS